MQVKSWLRSHQEKPNQQGDDEPGTIKNGYISPKLEAAFPDPRNQEQQQNADAAKCRR
jgi:hypothetical protein